MQLNNDRQIEQLLERFFEGETSNAEEQDLYRFFARKDLSESWKSYRPLFNYFETGITREENELKKRRPAHKIISIRYYLIAGLLIAASFLFILVLNNQSGMESDDFNPYAGSYQIRNKVRTAIPERMARQLCEERMANDKNRYFQNILEKQLEIEKEMEQREQKIDQIEKEYVNKFKQTE